MEKKKLKSILIVDDEEVMRGFLGDVLEEYEISTASDGDEAIEMLAKEKFDLIITDMKMPRVSGEEVVKFAKGKYPEAKIIVISGYSSLMSVSNTLDRGVNAFLSKPFTIKQIRAEVVKLLDSDTFSKTGSLRIIKDA